MKLEQESKMRIRLYNPKGRLLTDRLVNQEIELRMGPKIKHEGPISLEIHLTDKETSEKLIEYIKLLTGKLPIENRKKVKITKGTVELDNKEPLEDLMNAALNKAKTQEELIQFLRDQGFRFIDSNVITELIPELAEKLKLKEIHKDFQFMVRLVKEAKDPRKDKWDYRLLFGIKIVGKKVEKVVVYLFGKFKTKKLIPWKKENKHNFKKVDKVMVFPEHMDYDDRKKWRIEHVRLANNPNLKPTKFYLKNAKFVLHNGISGDKFFEQMRVDSLSVKPS